MIELIGWIGSASYLLNHAAFSLRPAYPRKAYFAANLFAAVCLVYSSAMIASWHPVANNGFWALTSAVALTGYGPVRLRLRPVRVLGLGVIAGLIAASLFLVELRLGFAVLGWISVFTYAAAYLAFAAGAVGRNTYLGANFIAAGLQMPIVFLDGNWPVFALQAAWGLLSLTALLNRSEDAGTKPWLAEVPPEVADLGEKEPGHPRRRKFS